MSYDFLAAKLSGVILYRVELGADAGINYQHIYFFWNGDGSSNLRDIDFYELPK
jgi:hypothetical protein